MIYDTSKPTTSYILKQIRRTWSCPWLTVIDGVCPLFHHNFTANYFIDHTDGIGTKGLYHWQKRTFRHAVCDSLAMNLNDLAVCRATPFKLQNHLTIPHDDSEAVQEIITALADECIKSSITITGG